MRSGLNLAAVREEATRTAISGERQEDREEFERCAPPSGRGIETEDAAEPASVPPTTTGTGGSSVSDDTVKRSMEKEDLLGIGDGADACDSPTFVRGLTDQTTKVGTRARFLVEIISNSTLNVEWLLNGLLVVDVPRYQIYREGNFFCLDVSPVLVEDEGRWSCLATNAATSSTSSASLRVLVPKSYKKPEFVEELEAVLTDEGTVSLECKVVGIPTPVLHWFKDGKEIKAGDVFALTASRTDDPTSLGVYTCEAVNCVGKAVSSSRVHVTGKNSRENSVQPTSINDDSGGGGGGVDGGGDVEKSGAATTNTVTCQPPIVIEELFDQKVKVGENVNMSLKVMVPPYPTVVQWLNKDLAKQASDKYMVRQDGSGGFSLDIQPTDIDDDGEWKCVLCNDGGETTAACNLTLVVPKNYRPPRFLENLKAILTEEGLVSFECKVVGFPTPQLQWFKDGQELKPGDVYQLSGTNSLGSYSCVAKNCMGQAVSVAELTVDDIQNQLNDDERRQLLESHQPPVFLVGLRSIESRVGDPLRLTVHVSSVNDSFLTTWYHGDNAIDICGTGDGKYRSWRDDHGLCHLDINPLEAEDEGEWKCIVLNDFGHNVTSCTIQLVTPRYYRKPHFLEPLRAVLSDEGTVNLECKVIGVPQPVLKWFKDGNELKPGDIHRIMSGQDGTCSLGTYTCQARNCMGSTSSSAALLSFEERPDAAGKDGDAEMQPSFMGEHTRISRHPSLSTIQEEHTSQISAYETPAADDTFTEEKVEISISVDGKDISVSLYETPDLTEEEAQQIVEMFAEELSERVSLKNTAELPSMRFTRETATSGCLLMEAIVIDLPGECHSDPQSLSDLSYEEAATDVDIEELSGMEALIAEQVDHHLCLDDMTIPDLPEEVFDVRRSVSGVDDAFSVAREPLDEDSFYDPFETHGDVTPIGATPRQRSVELVASDSNDDEALVGGVLSSMQTTGLSAQLLSPTRPDVTSEDEEAVTARSSEYGSACESVAFLKGDSVDTVIHDESASELVDDAEPAGTGRDAVRSVAEATNEKETTSVAEASESYGLTLESSVQQTGTDYSEHRDAEPPLIRSKKITENMASVFEYEAKCPDVVTDAKAANESVQRVAQEVVTRELQAVGAAVQNEFLAESLGGDLTGTMEMASQNISMTLTTTHTETVESSSSSCAIVENEDSAVLPSTEGIAQEEPVPPETEAPQPPSVEDAGQSKERFIFSEGAVGGRSFSSNHSHTSTSKSTTVRSKTAMSATKISGKSLGMRPMTATIHSTNQSAKSGKGERGETTETTDISATISSPSSVAEENLPVDITDVEDIQDQIKDIDELFEMETELQEETWLLEKDLEHQFAEAEESARLAEVIQNQMIETESIETVENEPAVEEQHPIKVTVDEMRFQKVEERMDINDKTLMEDTAAEIPANEMARQQKPVEEESQSKMEKFVVRKTKESEESYEPQRKEDEGRRIHEELTKNNDRIEGKEKKEREGRREVNEEVQEDTFKVEQQLKEARIQEHQFSQRQEEEEPKPKSTEETIQLEEKECQGVEARDKKGLEEKENARKEAEERERLAEECHRRETEEKARIEEEDRQRKEMEENERVAEEAQRRETKEKARLEEEERKRKEAEENERRQEEERERKEAEENQSLEEERMQRETEEWARIAEEDRKRKEVEENKRLEEERIRRETEEKARLEEEEKKRLEEEHQRKEAEEKARLEDEDRKRKEAEENERREEEERKRQEVQEKARLEEEDRKRKEAEENERREEEERQRREAEEKALREKEDRQRKEMEENQRREEEERQRKETQEKARLEEEERLRREAEENKRLEEERVRRETEERALREEEDRQRKEAQEKARLEEEERLRQEAEENKRLEEERVRRETEERALREEEERKGKEADEKARLEEEERQRKAAEENQRREEEERHRRETEEKARLEEEARKRKEAEEKALREEEDRQRQEAQEKARLEEEERERKAAEENQRREEEERHRRETEENARLEEEEGKRRQAEEKARLEEEEHQRKNEMRENRKEIREKEQLEEEKLEKPKQVEVKTFLEGVQRQRGEALSPQLPENEKVSKKDDEVVEEDKQLRLDAAAKRVEERLKLMEVTERKRLGKEERLRKEAEEEARAEEEVAKRREARRKQREAEEKAQLEEEELQARRKEERRKQKEAEAKARLEEEERKRKEAEERRRIQEEERRIQKAEEQARAAEEEKQRKEAAAKRVEERLKRMEAEEKARAEEEERQRNEAKEKKRLEEEERNRQQVEEKARAEAEEQRRKEEAAARKEERRKQREAEEQARLEEEERQRKEAEEKRRLEKEERKRKEAEEKAREEQEEQQRKEAAAKRSEERRKKKEAEEQARLEEEERKRKGDEEKKQEEEVQKIHSGEEKKLKDAAEKLRLREGERLQKDAEEDRKRKEAAEKKRQEEEELKRKKEEKKKLEEEEHKRKEAAEKKRKEDEELQRQEEEKKRLEEEKKKKLEDDNRKRKEAAEKKRLEEEELKRKEEETKELEDEERKQKEAAEKKNQEEEERKRKEEENKKLEEEERKRKEAAEKKRLEEEERKCKEEEKKKLEEEERKRKEAAEKKRLEEEQSKRKEEEKKKQENEERKRKEAAEKKRLEEEDRRLQEETEKQVRSDKVRVRNEEKKQKQKEDAEKKSVEERKKKDAVEEEKKLKKKDEKERLEKEEKERQNVEEMRQRKEAEDKERRDEDERRTKAATEKQKRLEEDEETQRRKEEKRLRREADGKKSRVAEEQDRKETEEKSQSRLEKRKRKEAEEKKQRDEEDLQRSLTEGLQRHQLQLEKRLEEEKEASATVEVKDGVKKKKKKLLSPEPSVVDSGPGPSTRIDVDSLAWRTFGEGSYEGPTLNRSRQESQIEDAAYHAAQAKRPLHNVVTGLSSVQHSPSVVPSSTTIKPRTVDKVTCFNFHEITPFSNTLLFVSYQR